MWRIILHIFILSMGGALEFVLYESAFSYSLQRRNRIWVRVICCLLVPAIVLFALSCGCAQLLAVVFSFETFYIEWMRIALSFVTVFLNIGGLFFCFKEKFVQLLYVAVAGKASQMIFSSLYSLLNNLTDSNSIYMFLFAEDDPLDVFSFTSYFFALIAVYLFVYFMFGRPFAKVRKEADRTINTYVLLLFAVILCVVIFFQGNNVVFYGGSKTVHNVFHFFIILFCLTMLFVERFMLYWIKDRQEAEAVKTFRENYRLQSVAIQRNMELVNIKCHDLKHQVREILSRGNIDDQFLDEVQRSISIYDTHISTGNEQLDVVLTEKSLVCEVNGVELTAMIDGAALDFMSVSDISSFFGNALDNAIEHLLRAEDKANRFIRISSQQKGSFLAVRIENYCSVKPQFDEKGYPVTSKNDKQNHGFGVRSMKENAEKYGGTLTYRAENNLFVLGALFPLSNQR